MSHSSGTDLKLLFKKLRSGGKGSIKIGCADPAGIAGEIRLLYDSVDYSSYCAEEKDRCFFDFAALPSPLDRFEVYKDPGSYMTTRRFLHITGGAGATHTFRALVREIEREFPIIKETSNDAALRSYLYFLRTALFWDKLGKIRDPRYKGLPFVVLNAPEEIHKTRDLPIKLDRKFIFIN